MKKKLIVCSLIFFVGFLYANEKSVWVTKEDINLKEFILDEDGVTRIETEKFELRDDYILIIRPIETVENDYICRSSQIYLLKDDSVKLIAENMDGGGNIGNSNKYLFRYEGIDFNNYFCLTRFEGNYYYYYLFDKATGNFEFKFIKGSVDLKYNIIIYVDESKNARQIILYDLTTQKKYDLDKYIKYGQYGSNTYWEDFQVVNVTEENYSIVFSGSYDENGEEVPQYFTVDKETKER